MTADEAKQILADYKAAYGETGSDDQSLHDVWMLEKLSQPSSLLISPATHPSSQGMTQKKEPVLGSSLQEAARRLRRKVREHVARTAD